MEEGMTLYHQWLIDNEVEYNDEGLSQGYERMGRDLMKMLEEKERSGKPIIHYRDEGIKRFSFAIPTGETISRLLRYEPFLEIGSGTGYWAYELMKIGANIIPSDPQPYSDIVYKPTQIYLPMDPLTADKAIEKHGCHRTLLMCWPSYDEKWPVEALKQYHERGGRRVIYIGEWGGCTADDEYHDFLENKYQEEEVIDIRKWMYIHDKIYVCRRRS